MFPHQPRSRFTGKGWGKASPQRPTSKWHSKVTVTALDQMPKQTQRNPPILRGLHKAGRQATTNKSNTKDANGLRDSSLRDRKAILNGSRLEMRFYGQLWKPNFHLLFIFSSDLQPKLAWSRTGLDRFGPLGAVSNCDQPMSLLWQVQPARYLTCNAQWRRNKLNNGSILCQGILPKPIKLPRLPIPCSCS